MSLLLGVSVASWASAVARGFGPGDAQIVWAGCPAGQSGNECGRVQLPLDPDNPSADAVVTAFIRRFYAGDAPTNNTLWMIAGGPGDSTQSFAGGAEFFVARDPTVTVYLCDQRGVGMSAPSLDCDDPPSYLFDPTNETTVASYRACNADIASNFAGRLKYYGTYYAAVDYKTVVDLVNPKKVAIYAMSYGTYVLNQYLQLDGARVDVAVMDGPVPPQRWALERDPEWKSRVAQDVLRACADLSPTCAAAMDQNAHAAEFLMDAVADGSLPCLAQLPWLTPYQAALYNLAMIQGPQHIVLGPFWGRVGRCSASDVEQLNFYHAAQVEQATAGGASPPAYTYGAAVTIGASEVFSFAEPPFKPATYAQLAVSSQRAFATAGVELILAHARDVEAFPLYTPDDRTYRRFAQPSAPLKVLVGTLDPQTPFGLGPWFVRGLGLPQDALVPVPYACHGTVSPADPCVLGMTADYLFAFGAAAMNTTCLAGTVAPDFEGASAGAGNIAMQYFGTSNLWNGIEAAP